MKAKLLFLCVLFSFFNLTTDLSAREGDPIVENPAYDLALTKKFSISKIELKENETRVHLQWNLKPGWTVKYNADTFLRDSETDKKYKVLKLGNGEEFNKSFPVDSTGHHHSILIFPPLEKGTEKIDYNDQFYGVYLNGKEPIISKDVPEKVQNWIDSELVKVKNEPIKNFESDEFFSRKPAKLIGYIKGYDQKLGFNTGIYYAANQLTREDYPVTIEIKPDGRFEAEIPLIHPVKSFIGFNNKLTNFYLEPGQTLAMVLDWEGFLEAEQYNSRFYPQNSMVFEGKLARVNKELINFEFVPFNYNEFKENVLNIYTKDLKKLALDEKKENEKLLAKYISESKLLEKTKTILTNEKDLITATRIFNYFMSKKSFQEQYPDNKILKEEIPVEYYSFLQTLPLNRQSLLINREFSEFVNRFEFAPPLLFHPERKTFTPEISVLEYFDKHNITLSEEEKKLLNPTLNSMEEVNQYKVDYEKFSKKYSEELKKYRNEYVTPFITDFDESTDYMAPWHKKDSVMTNHLQLKNDLIYDVTKTRNLKYVVETITEADQAYKYWDDLSATIENDFLREEGERIIENKFPKPEEGIDGNTGGIAVKNKTIDLPEGKAKEQFYNIINKYKGKIVFVDFWATTCGPCVATIKRMKETRKEYKDNPDFEFVFITDEAQSPLKSYEKFTKEQELEQIYRVDTDTYNRFRQLFKFNGIPRYVVLNKQGELINDDFKMYRFDSELPEILNEYK